MGIDFCVAPDEANTVTGADGSFVFGLSWGDGVAWSDSAVFRLVADDGSETYDFAKGDGNVVGDVVVFTFTEAQPGILYRGLVVDGDFTYEIFAPADLCGIQHEADPSSHLPFAQPTDDADEDLAPDPGSADAAPDPGSADAGSNDSTPAADDAAPDSSSFENSADGAPEFVPDDDTLSQAAMPAAPAAFA